MDTLTDGLGAACTVLLAVWLVLTVFNQFNFRWMRPVKALDLFRLIPRWTFFAPDPGLTDFHLSVRTIAADGTPSPWQEIDLIADRTILSGVWNPDKRITKAVIEVVAFLAPLCRDRPDLVRESPPYRCVLHHARRAAAHAGNGDVFYQFRLMETARARGAARERFFYEAEPAPLHGEYAHS